MSVNYNDFLEKKEAKQILLLKKLIISGGTMRFQEMVAYLNLSKASLETYITELIEYLKKYQDAITLDFDGEILAITLSHNFSLKQVEKDFYQDSLKYKIMTYLFSNPEFSTVALASNLKISESTLFRKIKELNSCLTEFDLMIWQGKLVGDEHQIRYFYFQLFWCIDHNFPEHKKLPTHPLVSLLEKKLFQSLSKESKTRLNLWVTISQKRMGYRHKKFGKLPQLFQPYQNDPLYLTLRELVFRSLGHYALELEEEEAIMQFIFILSMSILSEEDFKEYNYERSHATPTAITDTLVLECVLRYYRPIQLTSELEAWTYYQLASNHPRLYFFKGDIEVSSTSHFWQLEESLSSHNIKRLSTHLLTVARDRLLPKAAPITGLDYLTELKYLCTLLLVDRQISRNIMVGIDLNTTHLFKEAAFQMISVQLNSLNGVVCQEYCASQTYDLIITNEQSCRYQTHHYVLSELGTSFDIAQIKQYIRQIYHEKYAAVLTDIYL